MAHVLQCVCEGDEAWFVLLLQRVMGRSLDLSGSVTRVVEIVVSMEMVRDGVKIPQDGNRTNGYGHVAAVHEHVWRMLCSVCATGARVARPSFCNS